MNDEIFEAALKIINNADEPLETKEVEERLCKVIKKCN